MRAETGPPAAVGASAAPHPRSAPGAERVLGASPTIEEVLAALVDPTRRHLLDALAGRGEASATTLASDVPVSRQAVVKHLGALDRAGLVEGHRVGREVRYQIRSHALSSTAEWMSSLAASWDARLDAIKRIAEAPDAESPRAE